MSPWFTLDLTVKVLAAIALGGAIGLQRERRHKPAGFRTHILIVLGATVIMQTSAFAADLTHGDATRIASNIVVGIGFIGAGTIMKEGATVFGLTTAATIWVAGALGMAIGCGYYAAAILLTFATLVVLGIFGRIESVITHRHAMRRYEVVTTNADTVLARVRKAQDASPFHRGGLDYQRHGDRYTLIFELGGTLDTQETFFAELRAMEEVLEARWQ